MILDTLCCISLQRPVLSVFVDNQKFQSLVTVSLRKIIMFPQFKAESLISATNNNKTVTNERKGPRQQQPQL